jgi:cell wall-associated NlpC family hydrolase
MQRDLFKSAEQVGRSDLQPGDLLFFNTFARLSHVGIYIGEGRFIHAPRRGHNVSIESLDSKYYQGRYAGARRVMTSTTAPASQAPGL